MGPKKKIPKDPMKVKVAVEEQQSPLRRSARIRKAEQQATSAPVPKTKKAKISPKTKNAPVKEQVDRDDEIASDELGAESDEESVVRNQSQVSEATDRVDNAKEESNVLQDKKNVKSTTNVLSPGSVATEKSRMQAKIETNDMSDLETFKNSSDEDDVDTFSKQKPKRPVRKRSIRVTIAPDTVSASSSSISDSEASDFEQSLAQSSKVRDESESENSVPTEESDSVESDNSFSIPEKKARRSTAVAKTKAGPSRKPRPGPSKTNTAPLPRTTTKKMAKPWQKTGSATVGDIVVPPRELRKGEKKMLHFSRFAGRLAHGRAAEMTIEESTEIVNKMKAGIQVTPTAEQHKFHHKTENSDDSSSSDEDDWMEMEPVEEVVEIKDVEVTIDKGKVIDKDWWAIYLRQEVNKKIRETWESTHKVHILCYIAHLQYIHKTSLYEHVIPSVLISQLPPEIIDATGPASLSMIRKISIWFTSHFKISNVDVKVEESSLNDYPYKETARLVALVENKVYETDCERSLLMFATFVGLGCVARICVNTIPIARKWYEGMQDDIKKKKSGVPYSSAKQKKANSVPKEEQNYWVEVWDNREKRWICVNPCNGSVDKPYELEEVCHDPISYVLAIDNKKGVRDVSARYTSEFMRPEFRRRRTDQSWLMGTLAKKSLCADKERAELEDVHFRMELMSRPLPTTMSEYKNHPLYVLEKDLLKFEAIYPRPGDQRPLGEIRGHKVYPRDCVYTLQSDKNWEKMARSVQKDSTPYKVVKARPNPMIPAEQRVPRNLDLYGFWQTEPYRRLTVENGKIPKNEFGNVYIYQPSMCPIGTVHLRLPGLPQIARRLHKECVAAVVGWEFNSCSNFPTIEGACVLEEDVDLFVEEWKKTEAVKIERAKQKRHERIYGNWRKLISGILRLHYVTTKFAPVGGELKKRKKAKNESMHKEDPTPKTPVVDKNVSGDSGIIDMTGETDAQKAGLSHDDLWN